MGASSLLGEQVAHDGGILRSEHPNNVTWCPLEDQGHIKTYVKTGGAKIDVVRENSGYGLTFNWPILSEWTRARWMEVSSKAVTVSGKNRN